MKATASNAAQPASPLPPAASPTMAMPAAALARELAVDVTTVRRWDAGGRLPRPIRVGSAVRWVRSEIEAWLAAGAPNREDWETQRTAVTGRLSMIGRSRQVNGGQK